MANLTEEDLLLKGFMAEVSEVERDTEVQRILSCFKSNPFEHLNLLFDSSTDDVKKQYRKLSLMVHPDKCKLPQAKEAFGGFQLERFYEGREEDEGKKGETKPPKLKTEDLNKSYVQRPVKRG